MIGKECDVRVTQNQITVRFYNRPIGIVREDIKNIGLKRRNGTDSREWYAPHSMQTLRRVENFLSYPISEKIPDLVIERFLSNPPCIADQFIVIKMQEDFYTFIPYVWGEMLPLEKMGLEQRRDGLNMVYFWGKIYKVFHSVDRPKDLSA
jgi:hypothetical protein